MFVRNLESIVRDAAPYRRLIASLGFTCLIIVGLWTLKKSRSTNDASLEVKPARFHSDVRKRGDAEAQRSGKSDMDIGIDRMKLIGTKLPLVDGNGKFSEAAAKEMGLSLKQINKVNHSLEVAHSALEGEFLSRIKRDPTRGDTRKVLKSYIIDAFPERASQIRETMLLEIIPVLGAAAGEIVAGEALAAERNLGFGYYNVMIRSYPNDSIDLEREWTTTSSWIVEYDVEVPGSRTRIMFGMTTLESFREIMNIFE
jgi:hypothetical protein